MVADTAVRTASEADFTFQLGDLTSQNVLVTAFSGEEGLSELFSFHVELCSEDDAIDLNGMLGKPCLLEIARSGGESRFVHGMVCRFERVGQGRRQTHYAAHVVPVHWLLSKRQRARIFQQHNCNDMTVKGIITTVLESAGIPNRAFRFALQETYAAREYVVQYRETDMDFIARLMEEEGIFYYFEQAASGHKMVIADGPAAHVVNPLDGECGYREPTGLAPERDTFFALRDGAEIQIGSARLMDFDFTKPKLNLGTSAAGDGQSALEYSDYPGRYLEKSVGTRLARVRLEEQHCRKRVLQLAGSVRGLTPGTKFTLKDHPTAALNREYLVTHVSQRATQAQSAAEESGGAGSTYDVEVRVIPSDVPFRPQRVTRRPRVAGSQSAVVVGPPGEEIYTDKYGRVKVQFHWDLAGEYDETSSCFIRVAQGAAGGQYGMMFLPRVGQEVIVDFLEGDPDQPIIIGRVYNSAQMPPYTLPEHKTRSVIKTHSSKGGGGTNEILIEDLKDSEKILIYAQKDLHTRILNDSISNVVRDQHATVERHAFELVKQKKHSEVKLDLNEKIGGKHSHQVTGDFGQKVTGNISIEGNGNIYIKAAQNLVLEAGAGLTIKVGGNFVKIDASGVAVAGTMVKLNSGGAAAAGTAVALNTVEAPLAADSATPGQDTTFNAQVQNLAALAPEEREFSPAEVVRDEVATSWVEIELVDEHGQPIPGELYEITYPDGKTRRGQLDAKGQAHVGLKEPMNVQVTFPHLDAEAWERIR
jgi:type VI secretion system secreted protein VgrG